MKSISKCAFTLNAIYKIKLTIQGVLFISNKDRIVHHTSDKWEQNKCTDDVWDDRTSICADR